MKVNLYFVCHDVQLLYFAVVEKFYKLVCVQRSLGLGVVPVSWYHRPTTPGHQSLGW